MYGGSFPQNWNPLLDNSSDGSVHRRPGDLHSFDMSVNGAGFVQLMGRRGDSPNRHSKLSLSRKDAAAAHRISAE
jgi:hypothetical protein